MIRALGLLLLAWAPLALAMPWPEAVRTAAAPVAVQDGGRIKPLDTYARFALLQLSGRTQLRSEAGDTLSALDWLLEVLLQPERAHTRSVFLIENPEVMEALRLPHTGPRERFSFEVLAQVRPQLLAAARQYAAIEKEQRTTAQKQLLQLAHSINLFEGLTRSVQPLRRSDDAPLSALLALPPAEARTALAPWLVALRGADTLALIPPNPAASTPEAWQSAAGLVAQVLEGAPASPTQIEAVRALEAIAAAPEDTAALAAGFAALRAASDGAMGESREYTQIAREVFFYRVQPVYWALLLYALVLLLVLGAWLLPRGRLLYPLALAGVTVPLALHVFGIALRCLIRGRPPVTTLYETILFVTAVAVAVAFCAELLRRRRIALGIGAALGVLGLFLAQKYEAVDRSDTMPNLAAVLDTNFWLATHVTTVTMGYAAGLLAGALAHVYFVARALGLRRGDPQFYRELTRMVYGVFCFGLLFATVGTVLGGIWANDSWGRFWGWDPKENGALMIVLWGLAVLHARLGGYIRDYGLHLAALLGGVIVAYSWFGVNLLGVGLHSYGFTSGIATALTAFYRIEAAMLVVAGIAWVRGAGQGGR